MTNEIDVVVPTFNQSEHTINLIGSMERHGGNCRLIWVDNASHPDEYLAVERRLERGSLKHVRLDMPENLGFVKATNAGLAIATAPLVVLQNNDTEIFKHTYRLMARAAKRFGIVGPVSSSGWQAFSNLGPMPGGLTQEDIAQRIFQRFGPNVQKVDGMVAFFCAMLTREVISKVGYLLEEWGVGFGDDDDYCARARAAGFRVGWAKGAYCWHNHRTTFKAVYGTGYKVMQEEAVQRFREKWDS